MTDDKHVLAYAQAEVDRDYTLDQIKHIRAGMPKERRPRGSTNAGNIKPCTMRGEMELGNVLMLRALERYYIARVKAMR
jgi:hypothetical protein